MASQPDKDPPIVKEVPVEVKVPVPVDTPVVPEKIDHEVKKKTSLWGWLTTILGSGGAGLAGILGADWQTVIAIGGLAIVMLVIVILLRRQIIGAVQDIRGAVEG
jgi:putative chitinase